MRSVLWRLRIKPHEMALFKFILEGYDGIAMMRTLDPIRGIVCLHVSPGCEQEAIDLLNSLQYEITIDGFVKRFCERHSSLFGKREAKG